jgi:hypothetical protein
MDGTSERTEGQGVAAPVSASHGVDAFRQSISLQAAARMARIGERRATFDFKEPESEPSDTDGHSVHRSCKLVLGFVVGTALYARIMYRFMGIMRFPSP